MPAPTQLKLNGVLVSKQLHDWLVSWVGLNWLSGSGAGQLPSLVLPHSPTDCRSFTGSVSEATRICLLSVVPSSILTWTLHCQKPSAVGCLIIHFLSNYNHTGFKSGLVVLLWAIFPPLIMKKSIYESTQSLIWKQTIRPFIISLK